jgi:hypothetical protein
MIKALRFIFGKKISSKKAEESQVFIKEQFSQLLRRGLKFPIRIYHL